MRLHGFATEERTVPKHLGGGVCMPLGLTAYPVLGVAARGQGPKDLGLCEA